MLPLFHLPETKFWTSFNKSGASLRALVFEKPADASTIFLFVLGAGGGGDNNTDGGSSGGYSRLIIPALFLPDLMGIQIGAGGAGGPVSGSPQPGTAGGATSVFCFSKNTTVLTAPGGPAGGIAPSAASATAFTDLGIASFSGGYAGTTGGGAATVSTDFIVGGACAQAFDVGLSVTPPFAYPVVNGGENSGIGNGGDGYSMIRPILMFLGGGGGGAGGSIGSGGSAGFGCGGGAASGNASSAGGNGGDGFALIAWW